MSKSVPIVLISGKYWPIENLRNSLLPMLLFRGGNGLDWFSSLRCASLEDTSPNTYSVPKQGLLQVPAHYSINDSNSSLKEQGSCVIHYFNS